MTATVNRIAPKTDPAAIVEALSVILEPGQVTELRAIDAVTAQDRRPHVECGWFNDPAKLAEAAKNIITAKAVYFTPNPVNPAILSRSENRARAAGKSPTTSDRDIECRRWLLIDIDPERPADISATDDEHDRAIERARLIRDHLAADGWPDPVLADSGNGGHLMYRIDLPADDGGLIQRCLEALGLLFDSDGLHVDQTVFNPARIWKLPGTVSRKGDDTASRPHRLAKILEVPAELYAVPKDLLEALAAKAPKPAAPEWKPSGNGDRFKRFDVEEWIAEHRLEVDSPRAWQGTGKKWVFRVCPWNPSHTDRSAYIVQWPDGKAGAGCHHDGCASNDWHALRELVEPGYRDRRNGYQGNGHAGVNGHASVSVQQSNRRQINHEWQRWSELDACQDEPRYLVNEVVPEAQAGIISGRFKTLKTSVAAALFASMASGRDFLGRFTVPEAIPCGFMTAESGTHTIRETLRRIAAAMGIEPNHPNLFVSTKCPRLADGEHLGALEDAIKKYGFRCLAVDPSYLALSDVGDGASNVFKVGAVLERLTDLIQRTACAIILLNHNRKNRGGDVARFDPPELAEIAMSGFAEWARFYLLLGPQREWDPETGRHWLWMRTGGSGVDSGLWGLDVTEGRRSDPGGRKWQLAVSTVGDAKRDQEQRTKDAKRDAESQQLDEDKRDILETAAKFPGGETSTTLRDASGVRNPRFGRALAALLSDGDLVAVDIVKGNSRTYRGYVLGGQK